MNSNFIDEFNNNIHKASWGIGSYKYKNDWDEEEVGYGYYRPENPNDFSPDKSSCSERELTSHKAACEMWNMEQKEVTHSIKKWWDYVYKTFKMGKRK